MKKKVLITGANGFIGFHLIEAALNKGFCVCAAVRPGSKIDHLKIYDIEYCELDYSNRELLAKQLTSIDCNYIIHAAGATRAASQQAYDTINAEYAFNLASASLEGLGSRLARFVFISSLAAVGPSAVYNVVITDDIRPNPVTAYGRSKLLGEQKLQSLRSLPLVVLRPTAVYGPRERDIFILLRSINRGIEPYIGRIEQQLSFVYVKDLVSVVINSLFARLSSQGVFNISDGKSYGRYELANITKQILGRKTLRLHLPIKKINGIAFVLEKIYGWRGKTPVLNREKLDELTAINWQCCSEKATTQLGFNPQYSLEQGLRETLQWYRINKWL